MLRVGEGNLLKPPLLWRAVWKQMVRLVTQSGCQMLPKVPQGQGGGRLSFHPSLWSCVFAQCEERRRRVCVCGGGVSFFITLQTFRTHSCLLPHPATHPPPSLPPHTAFLWSLSLLLLDQPLRSSKGPLQRRDYFPLYLIDAELSSSC